jgi:transposase
MSNIKSLGIDLAKNIFQLHGVDNNGKCILKKRIKRNNFSEFIANLPPCLIAMEACGSAHYWARKFETFGHTVRLISPQFVKPFVKSNKNDANDAQAICDAANLTSMRFVPIKRIEHQDMQMLHRIRSQAVKQRTALANQIRGFLTEYGVILPLGIYHIRNNLSIIIEDAENELSIMSRQLFYELQKEFKKLDLRVKNYDVQIKKIANEKEACKRLMEIEGIGPLTATIVWATITQPGLFKNGRGVAAMLGLVPKQRSSGNKTRLLGISKRGDRYVRTLLIHGGRTVVKTAHRCKTKRQEWIKAKLDRVGFNKTAVAVANKNARIIWALLSSGESYRKSTSIDPAGLPQGTQAITA